MQEWEYMILDLAKPQKDINDLNRLGREGWEAVAMVSSWGVGWRWVHPIVLLKRGSQTTDGNAVLARLSVVMPEPRTVAHQTVSTQQRSARSGRYGAVGRLRSAP
jgi:hypothetical protein